MRPWGLHNGASLEEVKQAYKDLVNVWHPDRFAHNPRLQKKAEEKLKQINAAYKELMSFFEKSGSSYSGYSYKREPPRDPPPEPSSEPTPKQEESYHTRPQANQNINKSSPIVIVVTGILLFLLFLFLVNVRANRDDRPQPSVRTPSPPRATSPFSEEKIDVPKSIVEQPAKRETNIVLELPSTKTTPTKRAITPSQKKDSASIDNDHPSVVSPSKSGSTEKPDFSGLSSEERNSASAACSSAYLQGPAAYNACLNSQVNQLKR
ncbi:MAG: chaperone protein DnaJ [Syntrophorhabdus sp. PtaB.Bin027]|jgi:uracil-DNA glycosylase|nr:MAG: chaperone protein DnaJ [Syntrophorhabdus sp. PtaB.Bin027]HPW35939.1 J domain-containing protein [Syntrophorhabdus sp.]